MSEKTKKVRKHSILGKPVLGMILLAIWGMFGSELFYNSKTTSILTYLSCVVLSLVILFIHKWWFRPEYRGSFAFNPLSDQKLVLIICIIILLDWILNFLSIFITGTLCGPTVLNTGIAAMAGFCEETAFRGLPVSVCMRADVIRYAEEGQDAQRDRKAIVLAAGFSTFMFAVVHLSNLAMGADVLTTLLEQVPFCIGFGAVTAAIYLRTGNLLFTIVMHFVHDIISMCTTEIESGVMVAQLNNVELICNLGLSLILLVFAILLLHGHTEDIMEVWKERWSRD